MFSHPINLQVAISFNNLKTHLMIAEKVNNAIVEEAWVNLSTASPTITNWTTNNKGFWIIHKHVIFITIIDCCITVHIVKADNMALPIRMISFELQTSQYSIPKSPHWTPLNYIYGIWQIWCGSFSTVLCHMATFVSLTTLITTFSIVFNIWEFHSKIQGKRVLKFRSLFSLSKKLIIDTCTKISSWPWTLQNLSTGNIPSMFNGLHAKNW